MPRSRLQFFETRFGRSLLLLFLLAAGIPITMLAVVAHRSVSSELEALSGARRDRLAKSVGMLMGSRLVALRTLLEQRAEVIATPPHVDAGVSPITGFHALLLLDPDTDSLGVSPGLRDRLREGSAVLQRSGNHLLLGVPVAGSRRVLWGVIDEQGLWSAEDTDNFLLEEQDHCFFDHQGRVISCSLPDEASLWQLVYDRSERAQELTWRAGGARLVGSAWELFLRFEFGIPSWRVVVAEPEALSAVRIGGFTKALAGVIGLTGFLVLGLVTYALRHSLVPLRQLKEATVRLADGDLAHRVAMGRRRRDEFDEVADSFNRMATEIETHVTGLRAINAVDRAILSTLAREDVLQVVLTHALGAVPADFVAFALAPGAATEPWGFCTSHRGAGAGDTMQLAPKAVPTDLGDGNGVRVERRLLASLGAPSLAGGWLLVLGDPAHPTGLLVLGSREPAALDEPALRRLRHLLDQAAVAVKNVQLIEELRDLQRGALRALAGTIDAKSPWTAGHSERVTATAVALGRWMQLPEADIERLSRGGLLHDIGKIGIPIAVLDKPERLTEEERRIIETHPAVGAHILEPVKPFHDVIGIVRSHHERWDGKGYPDGLAGEEIPLLARIVAVADVYDAISSARPYRGATPPPVVLSIIERGSGTLFDPRIAEAFLAMMRQSGDAPPVRHAQVLAEAAP